MNARPPDADVRERIVEARGVNLSVEAGAGTGKTTLLVDHVVALVESGIPISRLALVTFTRKAASELRSRLRRRLAEEAATGAEWAIRAVGDLPRASVGTTDSFCRALLADFPLAAGLPPGFSLVDEIAQEALLDLAWDRVVNRGDEDSRELFARLREVGVAPARLRALAAEVIDHRDLTPAKAEPRGIESMLSVFERCFPDVLRAARACTDPEDLLLSRIRELERDRTVARALGGAAADRVLLRIFRAKGKVATSRGRAGSWGGKDGKARAVAALERLDEALNEALAARSATLTADVAAWLDHFAAEYRRVKRERGLVDFRDLALETRDLLRRDANLRRAISSRWDVVMLDEVQDTDPLQMEIAFLLTSREPADDPLDSRPDPGRLFLVGDPKQSIYRFRRADIELYEKARARIAESGEAPLITASFRSHPKLLDLVNRVFSGWMERPDDGAWQAEYVALEPGRPATEGDDAPRASLLLPDPELAREQRGDGKALSVADRGELEIDAVVRLVRRAAGIDGDGPGWEVRDPRTGEPRPAGPDDVAVLVRKIAWGEELVDALRLAGVPAAVAGGKRFHARDEIRTLATLLESVLEPEHRLSRFAALRGAAFALPDDDLVRRFDPSREPESTPRLAEAEATLDALADAARELPVPEFLETLAGGTALLAVFGFRRDGALRVESLRLLLEASESLADAGFDTLPAFVRWLREQESDDGRAVFGELDPGASSGVEVLTMHKAKGLEFPIVVLADLAGAPSSSGMTVCERSSGRLEFRLSRASGVATPGWDEAWERERKRRDAEEIRLLYVAMTRARDHLVLSWPEGKGGFLSGLPDRLGAPAGQSADADDDDLATIRVQDLAPVGEVDALHRIDLEAAWDRARRAQAPDLFAGASSPAPEPAARVTAATRLTGEPTAATSPAAEDDRRPAGWHATDFGTFLHRVLETVDAEPDVAGLVEEAIAAAGLPAPGADAIRRLHADVARILADPALEPFRRAVADERVQREVPFLLPDGDQWISGTIDAMWTTSEDGWALVDFKSGARRVDDDGTRRPAEAHVRQLRLYARAVTQLTDRPVVEARLLYLGEQPVHSATVSVPEAPAVR